MDKTLETIRILEHRLRPYAKAKNVNHVELALSKEEIDAVHIAIRNYMIFCDYCYALTQNNDINT